MIIFCCFFFFLFLRIFFSLTGAKRIREIHMDKSATNIQFSTFYFFQSILFFTHFIFMSYQFNLIFINTLSYKYTTVAACWRATYSSIHSFFRTIIVFFLSWEAGAHSPSFKIKLHHFSSISFISRTRTHIRSWVWWKNYWLNFSKSLSRTWSPQAFFKFTSQKNITIFYVNFSF